MSSVTVSIDPHVHSDESYDGHEPIELILEHAAEIGLDAVVITDHDVIGESKRAAELAPEYGLIGIPGVEVSTAHGHLLAVGVERMPPRRRPYDETIAWIHERGGVAIVPHPFQRSRHGVRQRNIPVPETRDEEVLVADGDGIDEVDAVETFNAWLFTGYRNRRARRFAAKYDYPGVAASDAHHLEYVGRAFTDVAVDGRESVADVTADDVLDAIREGTTTVDGRRAPIRMAAKHYVGAAGRKSGYYARTSAVRSATAARRGAAETLSAARVAAIQGTHRAARVLSWIT
ncbi:histidinol-phosphatase [Halorubrum sp. Ib24]|uniref:CehA/McbA family metallohydrolase n=1 Tax=unclassified Halorubrum TaxID=2642239 RepID=UPI000B997BA1|nr:MULTISPECIES: PHP domain-containing protein [unclassified Halorubrum]OYR42327.1 histidinol-phosphatase [Halorubrum sp. Ib24]OYR45461.1 histidinol-phosphatase [Halorubrum sp. Hd13]OYR45682.1 histidinol-phosphatase [Halorubrum sp. Ea8]OYR49794.1 histidinol-phosphatase [Halorubrum sp. Eb13]OYR55285.1 histidinol-phosphatase [Halorubrum sp. Ea1]